MVKKKVKKRINAFVALFVVSSLFSGCAAERVPPGERLLSMLSYLSPLPAGTFYTSDAKIYEEGYMREGLLRDLYDLRGYGEYRKIEAAALYIGASAALPYEAAAFYCRDECAVFEVTEMCAYRADFLARYGESDKETFSVFVSGTFVAAFYGIPKDAAASAWKRR